MKNQKLRLCSTVFFVLIFNLFISAQENQTEANLLKNNNNHIIDVIFVNGYGLGYNILSDQNSEIRLMLDIYGDGRFINEDGERIEENDTTINSKINGQNDTEDNTISLTAQYLYKYYKSEFGELYFGGGPLIGYNRNNFTYENNADESKYTHSSYSDTYSVGANVLLGVRGYLYKSISIFGELQVTTKWSWRKQKVNSKSNDIYGSSYYYSENYDNDYWEYSIRYARVGIRFSI